MSLLRFVLSVLGVAMYCVLNAQTLKFGSDRKFKIVQFTDVHWVSGSEHSVVSEKCMNRVLDEEKPDLVVFQVTLLPENLRQKDLKRCSSQRCRVAFRLQ